MDIATVTYKQQEALFRQTVHAAHRMFCNCGDPAKHLKGWRSSGEGTSTGGSPTTIVNGSAHTSPGGEGHGSVVGVTG